MGRAYKGPGNVIEAVSPAAAADLSSRKKVPVPLPLACAKSGTPADEATLRKLYGLTRSKTAVMAILLKGGSIEEAAAALLISRRVVRSHLRRIFMKTDALSHSCQAPIG